MICFLGQRRAARARGPGRCSGGADPAHRGDEAGEVGSGLPEVADGAAGVAAGQSLVNGPGEGVAVRRLSQRHLHGQR